MEQPNVNNETFVAPNPNSTPAGPINPVAAAIKAAAVAKAVLPSSPQLDSTFNVAPPAKSKKNSVPPQDSIMTEDLSMAVEEPQMVKQEPLDSPPRKPAPAKATSVKPTASKKNMEIFK